MLSFLFRFQQLEMELSEYEMLRMKNMEENKAMVS